MSVSCGVQWDAKIGLYFERQLELRESETGPAINLTGYGVRAQIRNEPEDVAALASFNTSIVDATAGRIDIWFTVAQMLALQPGKYVFSVVLDPPDNKDFEIISGTFHVAYSITR